MLKAYPVSVTWQAFNDYLLEGQMRYLLKVGYGNRNRVKNVKNLMRMGKIKEG